MNCSSGKSNGAACRSNGPAFPLDPVPGMNCAMPRAPARLTA
jgi:hypothetical protein